MGLGMNNLHNGFRAHIRVYLLGILNVRLGDYDAACKFVEEL
jgi:hypothetical protein